MWEDFPGKDKLDFAMREFYGSFAKAMVVLTIIRLLLGLVGSTVLIAIFYFIAAGIAISYIGGISNMLVLYTNKGLMPVLLKDERWRQLIQDSSRHCVMTEESRFKLLCDRFESRKGISSIGDILLEGGLSIALIGITIFLIAAFAIVLFLIMQWMLVVL